jgi:capsular exopolysaccharide synthesis family protein
MVRPSQNGNGNGNGSVRTGTDVDAGTSPINSLIADSLVAVIWRNRWIVLITTVVTLAAAVVYLAKATPIYTSTSRIYVEQSGPKIFTETEEGVMTRSKNFLYTQSELLKSLPIVMAVLKDPTVGRMRTLAGCDNPTAYLKKNLRAAVGKKDDIISVSFDSPYPNEAARLVNGVVDAYLDYHATRKRSTSAEVLRILQSENTDRLKELSRKRQAMVDFKQKNTALAFESKQGNIVMERLNRLSSELTEAQLATIESESIYEYTKEVFSGPAKLKQFVEAQRAKGAYVFTDSQNVQLNARLNEFQLRRANRLREVKSGHPAVTALEVEIANLTAHLDVLDAEFAQAGLALAEQEYLTAKDKEDKIAKHYDNQCQQALELGRQVDQYEMLRLDWEQTKKLCDTLSNRIKELNVTENVGALNISILEVARPADKPSEPQKARMMAIALVFGLMLSGGLALLRDWMDQRLRSTEEIATVLGIPVLGVVPSMSGRLDMVGRGQKVHKDSDSSEAEAYRTIRTAVFFGAPKDEARRILVTSPTAGDGKTTLVSNLAIAMAQAGQKTLIIDADFRRPMQQKIFEMNHEKAGLSSVIAGLATFEEGIQPSGIDGLDLLLCGPHVPNPSEMLNSDSFAQLLEILADKYDRILVDSPPVMSVTDAQITAAICDVTLLVLRAEKSTRNVSRQARDGLLSVGARVLGVIVNDVKKKSRYVHYSGYGYYPSHYGYGHNKKKRMHDREPSPVRGGLDSYRPMKAVLGRKDTSLSQQSRDLLEVIQAYTQPEFGRQTDGYTQFTQKDCEEWAGLSHTTIRCRLGPLVGAGIVEVDESSKPYKYKVTHPEVAKPADRDVPSPEDISERIGSMTS